MLMIEKKNKIRIRRRSCYCCSCTGLFKKKQIIFQIWNWGYNFINRDISNHCEGRGYIKYKRKYETFNNCQSYLEH